MSDKGETVTVYHLPAHVVSRLDEKFGQLIAANGGFADWLLKIDSGKVRYIQETDKEFLEPTNEARKQRN